jgi:hypothetical protein
MFTSYKGRTMHMLNSIIVCIMFVGHFTMLSVSRKYRMTDELERIRKEAIGVYSRNYPGTGLEGPGKTTENHTR